VDVGAKIEVKTVSTSETSVSVIQRSIPEGSHFRKYFSETLKSHLIAYYLFQLFNERTK
jgi:hypothetical protein